MKPNENKSPDFAQKLAAAKALIEEAIQSAQASVKKGPDNPNIKRLNDPAAGGPTMFRVSSSELFRTDNWSPGFHDWKSQYEHVSELLAAQRFAAIRRILKEGKYSEGPGLGNKRFAPEVVEHLRMVLGNLEPEMPAEDGPVASVKRSRPR